MNSRILTTVMVLLFGIMSFANAAHHETAPDAAPEKMGQMTGHMVEMMTAKLDLNEDQVSLLNALRDKIGEIHSAKSTNKTEARETLLELMAAPTLDQKAMFNTVKSNSGDFEDIAKEYIPVLAAFTDSLSEDQKEIFLDCAVDMFLPGMHGMTGGFHGKKFQGKSHCKTGHGKKCCPDSEYKKCCPKGDKKNFDRSNCPKTGDSAQCRKKCDKSKCDPAKCKQAGDTSQCNHHKQGKKHGCDHRGRGDNVNCKYSSDAAAPEASSE